MEPVAEQTVIRPVCCGRTDGHHGNVVNQEHDRSENRQSQPAVGDDPVDLIRCSQFSDLLFLVAGLDHFRDVNITFVGDDAFRVIIQFLFGSLNILFNMRQGLFADVQLLHHFVIAFEDFDCIPALLFFRHIVHDSLFNVGNGMLDRSGEGVHRDRFAVFRGIDRGFRSFHDARSLECGDRHNFTAELTGEFRGIDLVSFFLDHVHHIDRQNDRDPELGKLGRQVKVAFQVGAVDDVQDGIRPFIDQIISGYDFFKGIR